MSWTRGQRTLVLLLLLLTGAPGARAGFDAFMKIDGVNGESTNAWHTNWISVLALTNELARNPLVSSGTSSLSLLKQTDKSSPSLYLACATGQRYPRVILDCCDSQATNVAFTEMVLSNVVVKNVQLTGSTAATNGPPQEKIVLSYDRISWTYTYVSVSAGQQYYRGFWDLLDDLSGVLLPRAVFNATITQVQPGQVVLNWLPQPGKTYQIFSSPQVEGPYTFLAEVTPVYDDFVHFPVPITGNTMFFRIEEIP